MTPGDELLFLALGGSGEIGMNVNLYGCDGKWLMVDLGMTFAGADYPGVDLILPDLQFIEDRRRDLLGVVITHGHEDHIGAIPYLAADLGVPIYATPFAAGLIHHKLEEEGLTGKVKVRIVRDGDPVTLGKFTVRHVPLAHSIPEGNALLIETPHGTVFHTGDWKLDEAPQLGTPSTPDELRAIGDAGVLAMVCDSTNVFQEGTSGSEASVRKGLDEVVAASKGRVVVTTFASNAARMQTLGEVARDTGRQVVVAGRSIERILKVAKATGYLKDFPETVRWEDANRLPRDQVLVIATGGQGEDRAALSRMAFDSHPVKIEAGDTVVFSSRQIPGNEGAIGRVANQLAQRGIELITERQAAVHVSGHPGRAELKQMYEWIRPEILVPTHGEPRHLAEHARFAKESGIAKTLVQRDGELIRLAPNGPKKVGHAPVGRLMVDGDVILPADGATTNERRRIAANGVISVAAALGKGGKLLGDVQIRIQGVPVEEDKDDFIADARDAVVAELAKAKGDEAQVREAVRLALRRCATLWTGKKPVVDVLLIRT